MCLEKSALTLEAIVWMPNPLQKWISRPPMVKSWNSTYIALCNNVLEVSYCRDIPQFASLLESAMHDEHVYFGGGRFRWYYLCAKPHRGPSWSLVHVLARQQNCCKKAHTGKQQYTILSLKSDPRTISIYCIPYDLEFGVHTFAYKVHGTEYGILKTDLFHVRPLLKIYDAIQSSSRTDALWLMCIKRW